MVKKIYTMIGICQIHSEYFTLESKYMGERYVCENAERFLVCRAGWMMGSGPKKDKKFIHKLLMQTARYGDYKINSSSG